MPAIDVSPRRTSATAPKLCRALPALLLAASMTLAGTASPALAHDALASTSPTADKTVSTPLSTVSVTFAEQPLADFTSALALRVVGPDNKTVTTGAVTVTGNTLGIPVRPTMRGTHHVTWQSVSSDGHPVTGTFAFTYAGPTPAPSPTPVATTKAATPPAPTISPGVTPAARADQDTSAATLEYIGSGLLVALAAGVIIVMLRRASKTEPTP